MHFSLKKQQQTNHDGFEVVMVHVKEVKERIVPCVKRHLASQRRYTSIVVQNL